MSHGKERLLFGELQLARSGTLDHGSPYELYALADDATFGNPAPVTTVWDSLLGDGQLVSIDRHHNREGRFGIRVKADDGAALAAAEAALVAETEKPNTLTWIGPDGYTPATVFDVLTSWVEHILDSDDENNLSRKYILNLSLYPHPRSSTSTTVPAIGSGITPTTPPTEVTVTTASSLTGWTGRPTVPDYVDPIALGEGSYVYQRADVVYDLWLTYDTGAVQNWSATRYLTVDWGVSGSNDASTALRGYISGPNLPEKEITKVAEGPSPFGGANRRSVFRIPVGDANLVRKVKFLKANDLPRSTARWSFWVTNILVSDGGAANDGTSRQLARSLEIRGSARAMGVIDIRHENALGDVLVWSGPAACSPPLRATRISGAGAIADTSAVSGAVEDIGTSAFVSDVPLSTLPIGAYLVMARLAATDTAGVKNVDVTAQTRLSTSDTTQVAVGPTLTLNDTPVDLALAPTFRIVPLGVLHLPSTEVSQESGGYLRVAISGAGVRIDEAWLYNVTDGSLTFVKAADKVLVLTSPTVNDPRRRVWTGPASDALYDAGASTENRGHHPLSPGLWAAHTVTTGAQNAAVTLIYDKRWHSHAAEDG